MLVAGVAGSGKSTVGRLIAGRLGWAFEDGDALQPAANIAKMRSGRPLDDADRQPWLRALGGWLDNAIAASQPAVVACSALKRSYRDALRRGRPGLVIVVLAAERRVAADRLAGRQGHFFPRWLLDSQFADLEMPSPSERALVIPATGTPVQVAEEIIRRLGLEQAGAAGRA